MCDTIVILPPYSQNGVLFGKNSDREPNEAQIVEYHEGGTHKPGEKVKCTYISIPQAEETYSIIISRPYWMWGAEMGINEHGVAIGNEAVFTKEPLSKIGLTGMDMLRIALERSKDADEALRQIIELIETFGQGGSCSNTKEFSYHNSFLIADPGKAWVLETAGKYWVAKKVKGYYAISNLLTIGDEYDLISEKAVENAITKGYCRKRSEFSFSQCYTSKLYTYFSKGWLRRNHVLAKIKDLKNGITLNQLTEILRSHRREEFNPARGSMGDVCMHAGGPIRDYQTAGSFKAILKKTGVAWFTATSIPCISIYKPFYFGVKIQEKHDMLSHWLINELLNRKLLKEYTKFYHKLKNERDIIEKNLQKQLEPANASIEEKTASTITYIREAESFAEKWSKKVKDKISLNPVYQMYWWKKNKELKETFKEKILKLEKH